MMRKVNNISFGLFIYRGKYWWRNIRDIRILFKRIVFVLKHGYSPQARWETSAWFIDTMKEILENYRDHRCGNFYIQDVGFDSEQEDKIFNRMIELLDAMDEENPLYKNWNWDERDAVMENAKDEFFELFSKYFYNLWD